MEIRASVALAAYNGEKYIREQINSIIEMMDNNDELVISYEESSDNTLNIIKEFSEIDKRIKIIFDSGKSVESNFNNAVSFCNGKYIFLSDQDDVWIDNKISKMCNFFEKNKKVKVLICNGWETDSELNTQNDMFTVNKTNRSALRNYMKGSYLGCQMAFSADLKSIIWPVRQLPPLAHDLWLGVCGSFFGDVALINEKLILHRIHSSNYSHTSKLTLKKLIENRFFFFLDIITTLGRNFKFIKVMKNKK